MENIVRKGEIAFTTNYSFSHNVFHSYKSSLCQTVVLYGNGLNVNCCVNSGFENATKVY